MNCRERIILAKIMKKNISKTCLLGFFCIAASVSFADEYKVKRPLWLGDPVPTIVEYDISSVIRGEILELDFVGYPIWIYRRTDEEIRYIADNYSGATPEEVDGIIERIVRDVSSVKGLTQARYQLFDLPELEKNPYRSKRKEYFVFDALGRYGCTLQMELPMNASMRDDAKFHDPCVFGTYDLAGRSIAGNTDGKHIRIPPHEYLSDNILSLGVSDFDGLPQISLSEESLFSGLTATELLLQATAFNDLSRAQAAIKAGANVNAPGPMPRTTGSLPLLRAVLYSSTEMVELLLLHGATPGKNEIEYAIDYDRRDVSRLLDEASN